MTTMTKDMVLALLRTGTPEERAAFVQGLPPNSYKNLTLSLVGSHIPGMVVVALGSLIQEYCFGSNPECGSILASAAHERAREIVDTVPYHGLLPATLCLLALSHVKALTLLGRSQEAFEATNDYVRLYKDDTNAPQLRMFRIEALVNLKKIDEAAEALQDQSLFQNPATSPDAIRLKGWVDKWRTDATTLRLPHSSNLSDSLNTVKSGIRAMNAAVAGVTGASSEYLEKLATLDARDPDQLEQSLEMTSGVTEMLTKGGMDSVLAQQEVVSSAMQIIVSGTWDPNLIKNALANLESAYDWAHRNGASDLENTALYQMSLCRNRLHQHSEAADMLIALRKNLESIRCGIKDPFKRGGVFAEFYYLFNCLCEHLYKANRREELLEAIESSKGRVIADRLTAQTGDIVDDSAIYGCVSRLPELVRREQFHYLTFFVDEECVYAILVSKQGTIHAIDPVKIANSELRGAAGDVDPGRWGQPKPWAPGEVSQDTSARLAPLVAWLDELLNKDIVEKGDHICYSPDDALHNIPLQYLHFRSGIVIDWFSVSRVHSAFHLDRVLSGTPRKAPKNYVGFVVPLRQDVEAKDGIGFAAKLDAPLQWLKSHRLRGKSVGRAYATLDRLRKESLHHKIVHFSTHGWFPQQGNPFHGSFLLLADKDGLPDREGAVGGHSGSRLTPSEILDSQLDFGGSHVSMMACVSGLAKEGIGGDSLGLDWALIQAGASSLISTHWKVSAASAARFFTLFYQNWIENQQSRAAAFRNTMLELMNGENAPKSLQQWAAFSLTGDIR